MTPARSTVLFALSDTGGGHRSAAVAIDAALRAASPETIRCDMLDVLRVSNFPIIRNAPSLYDKLSTKWLRFYNLCFRLSDGAWQVHILTRLALLWAQRSLVQVVQTNPPDIVVCTHPLVLRPMRAVQRATGLPFPIAAVVTDLVSLHHSWSYPAIDLYLLPTDEAYEVTAWRGIPQERMRRTGFPVHPKFVQYDRHRALARRELGIAPDCSTLLLTGGGVGSGQMMNNLVFDLEWSYPALQLLVVTGKNQERFAELQARKRNPHTHIYGFVQNMEMLMAASDVVITKAGPGTLMEALVMRRPVIITEAVGLQEHGNIDFVVNNKLGFFCPSIERIKEALDQLLDATQYANIVTHLKDAVPRNGAEEIAHILLEQLGSVTSDA
jgi:UDP-N-acetylglucosamine:LPS N-acetylglucosamine transferase